MLPLPLPLGIPPRFIRCAACVAVQPIGPILPTPAYPKRACGPGRDGLQHPIKALVLPAAICTWGPEPQQSSGQLHHHVVLGHRSGAQGSTTVEVLAHGLDILLRSSWRHEAMPELSVKSHHGHQRGPRSAQQLPRAIGQPSAIPRQQDRNHKLHEAVRLGRMQT